jgi:tetratricopeptide (TPR) repeat protein
LGERHPDVATSLNNLAGLYRAQGRYDEAEPLYRQALELSRELLGERHPDVATSLNNLAYLYQSQGRYDEAEPLYRQALELSRELLGSAIPMLPPALIIWPISTSPRGATTRRNRCTARPWS